MTDENGARSSLSAAGGRMEGVRRRILSKVGGSGADGPGEDGEPTTGSGLPAPQGGPQGTGPRPCEPKDMHPLVRLLWKGGWQLAARAFYDVELDDTLFPQESTEEIAEALCPVMDKHFPAVAARIGPEATLASAVLTAGAAPAAALHQQVQERKEAEEEDGEQWIGEAE